MSSVALADATPVRVGLLAAFAVLAAATGCAGSGAPEARLRYAAIPVQTSSGADRTLEYAIYTPPDFHVAEQLPLVVFLHGAGDGPHCFDDSRVGQHLDLAMAAGEVPRAVIVVPRGDLGFWENWADGSYLYRDWVLRTLVPEIQAQYHTAACPAGCHLVGISMGGHGALRFLLFEPDFFATVTAVSAPIVDSEMAWRLANESLLRFVVPTERIWGPGTREDIEAEDPFLRWTSREQLDGTRLMLAWGADDHARIVESNERFVRHLDANGIPHTTFVFPGGHGWSAWKPALDEVLATQLDAPDPPAERTTAHTK